MDAFLVVVMTALAVWGLLAYWKKLKDKSKENTSHFNDRTYRSSYRGELGSSGMSPKFVGQHSANCECAICLYGHDPDNATYCQCRWCEGYRRGKPLH